jgi:hypothetical protein
MAARFEVELIQYDAVNAFVNARLDQVIYMKMPPSHGSNKTVGRLNKARYRLR